MKVTEIDKKTGQVFNSSNLVFEDIPDPPAVAQYVAGVEAVVSKWTREDLLEKHNQIRASRGLPPRTMEEFNS